ncbi:MAG: hypothetical protein B6D58_07570 [candidate division Zixibacteria bacterium 4484_95]|nr:MAG: hypothetical protein B6D58_07570 [candidate division Zixibacteria bacterium 4484_95]RKX18373.1 MAG: hypothetical protein DRP26_05330 [candidate division Zixibacteria bacterium]
MVINILHLRSGFRFGGPEKLIINSLKYMADSEFRFILSSFILKNIENEFLRYANNQNIKTEPVYINSPFDLSSIRSLKEIIKKHDIRLLIAHDYRAVVISYFARRNTSVKLVAVAHGWTSQSLKIRIYEFVEKRFFPFMDKVVAVSGPKYEELLKLGLPKEKTEKIENCVEIPPKEKIVKTNQLKEELGLLSDDVLIGSVGRLGVEKGHKYLIESSAKLKNKFPSARYVIIGDGSEMANLKSLAERLGVRKLIHFCGWRSDIETIYRGLDIFVLPSLTEGLPIALLEAMSYALPVIASSVGGCPDVVISRKSGILVKPADSDRLADAIGDLIDNKAKRDAMGLEAYSRILENYNMKKYSSSFLELFKKMLSQ